MKLIQPVAIVGPALISSTVPEADYPEWSGVASYALGARVVKVGLHRIFESAIAGNTGHDPAEAGSTTWIDAGPTNRWAMFDPAAGAATFAVGSFEVQIAPGEPVRGVAALDVDAASVRVRLIVAGELVYDRTAETSANGVDRHTLTFLDLPAGAAGQLIVTVAGATGATPIALGKLIVGDPFDMGVTESGATISITDFSRRDTDDFGITTIVERAWAKKVTFRSRISSDMVDEVQRRAVAARAKPALWVGEDTIESLTLYGFYNDFSIDLQLGDTSYCSLTVEGLPGYDVPVSITDPAPGQASDFMVIRPQEVVPGVLYDSSVPENDYPQWDAVTSYPLGARVLRGAAHLVFESAIAANANHDPAGGGTQWVVAGPTNRWAMFDQALGSVTTAPGQIVVELIPTDALTALAVLDSDAATVRVQAPGYDRTAESAGGSLTFLDLAVAAGSTVTVTIAAASGAEPVSVGTLLIGTVEPLGITETSPTISISDYSRKETDQFGTTTAVERAWAKRMAVRALVTTTALETLVRRVATLRAKPALWIAQDGIEALTIYGFFRDFSVDVVDPASVLAVTIEGLTTASALGAATVDWANVIDSDPENHPRPADGATVGAPAGTPVGDLPAETVSDAVKGADGQVLPARVLAERIATTNNALDAARGDIAGAQAGLAGVRDDLAAEIQRATDDTAAIRVVQTQLQEGLSGNVAALEEAKTTLSNADASLAARSTSLETRMGSAEGAITETAATLSAADRALADRSTALETRMGSAETHITDNFTALSAADQALAGRSTALETRMGAAEAKATDDFTTLSNADQALAGRSTSLETRMGSAETHITDNFTALSAADQALAGRSTALETRMGSAEAAITDNATAASNAITAVATRTSGVEARAGSLEGRATITESAVADAAGKLAAARLELAASSPGGRVQMTLHSDTAGGAGIDIIGDVRITGENGGGRVELSGQGIRIYYPNGQLMFRATIT